MVPIPLRGSVNGAGGVSRTLDCTILRARHPQTERQPRGVHGPREASALIVFGLWSRRFRRPWSGDVPSGESVNPGGWAMADETPKAPEPELSIAPEGEAKPPARPRNLYAFVKQAWKNPRSGVVKETHFQRMVEWRRGNAFVRLERPTRIDRARELGYRAKQGYVVVRARVHRGSMWDAIRPTSSSESPMTGSNTGTLRPSRSVGSNEDHRVPRNTASARVILTSSASRPLGGKSRTFRRTSH